MYWAGLVIIFHLWLSVNILAVNRTANGLYITCSSIIYDNFRHFQIDTKYIYVIKKPILTWKYLHHYTFERQYRIYMWPTLGQHLPAVSLRVSSYILSKRWLKWTLPSSTYVLFQVFVTSAKIFLNRRHYQERSRYHSISGTIWSTDISVALFYHLKAMESIRCDVIHVLWRTVFFSDAIVHLSKNSKLNFTAEIDVGYWGTIKGIWNQVSVSGNLQH